MKARPIAIIATALLAALMLLSGAALWAMLKVPARPMFHNTYAAGPDGRPPWRIWQMCPVVADDAGNWMWADFPDNTAAIVVTGDLTQARTGPIVTGISETKFKVGADESDKYVTVGKDSNRLLIISPSGEVKRIALRVGLAREIYQHCSDTAHHERHFEMFSEVAKSLDGQERQELDAILAAAPALSRN
jgi:hypothetical protein